MDHIERGVEHQQVAHLRHVAQALVQGIGHGGGLMRYRGEVNQQHLDRVREARDVGRDGLCGARCGGVRDAFRTHVTISQQAQQQADQGQQGEGGADTEQPAGGHRPGSGIDHLAGQSDNRRCMDRQPRLLLAPGCSPHRGVPSPG